MTRPSKSEVRGTLIDAAAAVVLAWLAVSATLDPPGPAFAGPAWVAWLAGATVAIPLVMRRRWPVPAFAFALLAAVVATGFGVVGPGAIFTTWVPVAVALYTAATTTRAVTATLLLGAALIAPAIAVPWLYARAGINPAAAPASEAPLWWQVEVGVIAVSVAAAWTAGRLVRWRRGLRAELARRSARDAVAAERLRIARELHDIVGHSMSLIAVKATVANHIADERPAETRAALLTIEQTSRSALTEMRRLLDVLRDDDPVPTGSTVDPAHARDITAAPFSGTVGSALARDDEPAPTTGTVDPGSARSVQTSAFSTGATALAGASPSLGLTGLPDVAPSPRLADLPDLVARVRTAGMPVDLELDDTTVLPADVGLAVYRIVQESLTNVIRHADARLCRVRVRDDGEVVNVEVVNDDRARRPSSRNPPGRGIIGMRERVTMYGGTLTYGPRLEGGFEVVAAIPYATTEETGPA